MKMLLTLLKRVLYRSHRYLVKLNFSYSGFKSLNIIRNIFLVIKLSTYLFAGISILLLYFFSINLSEYLAMIRESLMYYVTIFHLGYGVVGPFLFKIWVRADKFFTEHFGPSTKNDELTPEDGDNTEGGMSLSDQYSAWSKVFGHGPLKGSSLPDSEDDDDDTPVTTPNNTSPVKRSDVIWWGLKIVTFSLASYIVAGNIWQGTNPEVLTSNAAGGVWLTITTLASMLILGGSVPLSEGDEHWPDKELEVTKDNVVDPADPNSKTSKFFNRVKIALFGESAVQDESKVNCGETEKSKAGDETPIPQSTAGDETPTNHNGVTPKASTSALPPVNTGYHVTNPEHMDKETVQHAKAVTTETIEQLKVRIKDCKYVVEQSIASDAMKKKAGLDLLEAEIQLTRESSALEIFKELEVKLNQDELPRVVSAEKVEWSNHTPDEPVTIKPAEPTLSRHNSPEVSEWNDLLNSKGSNTNPTDDISTPPTSSVYSTPESSPTELLEDDSLSRSDSSSTLRAPTTNTPVDHSEPVPGGWDSTPHHKITDESDGRGSDSDDSDVSTDSTKIFMKNKYYPLRDRTSMDEKTPN